MLDSIIFYSVLTIVCMFMLSVLIYIYGTIIKANKQDVINWLITYMGGSSIVIVISIITFIAIGQ